MKKRGRPKSDISKKKEALLLVGAELFRTYGFDKVSIEEICENARASKMTFYRQFKDKADLSLCLLEKYNLEAKETVVGILAEKVPFSEKFIAVMQLNERFREKMGLRFIEDLINCNDPKITTGIRDVAKQMELINFQFIEMGKAEGFLNPDFKLEFILLLIEKINILVKDPELTKIYPDFSEKIRAVTSFFHFGITAQKY